MLAKRHSVRTTAGDQGLLQGGLVETRERLLTPGEVANLFRVDPKTVTRWAAAGRIAAFVRRGAPQVPRVRGPSPVDGRGRHAGCTRCATCAAQRPRRHRRPERQYHLGAIGSAPTELAGPAPQQVVLDAQDVEHLAGDEIDECVNVAGARVERGARWEDGRARLVREQSKCRSVGAVSGVSRGTTTSARRSFKVTSAARCKRSFDRPRAIPATAAVLAGMTTMPRVR